MLLGGGLPACGVSASQADVAAAELQAQSARAEAVRDQVRLIELEARLVEMEHRLARQARACEAASDSLSADGADSRDQPRREPLRSEGDFLAEAHTVAPTTAPPAATIADGASRHRTNPASERQRVAQLLEALREHGLDPQNGLSPERREALRVLLRRERQLDLMNPWNDR